MPMSSWYPLRRAKRRGGGADDPDADSAAESGEDENSDADDDEGEESESELESSSSDTSGSSDSDDSSNGSSSEEIAGPAGPGVPVEIPHIPIAVEGAVAPGDDEYDSDDGLDIEVQVGGGRIHYYGATKRFVAYCDDPRHKKCSRERVAWQGHRPSQGRPLGLLSAWLGDAEWESMREHCDIGIFATLDARRESRNALLARAAAGEFDVARLLRRERKRRPTEEAEPDVSP